MPAHTPSIDRLRSLGVSEERLRTIDSFVDQATEFARDCDIGQVLTDLMSVGSQVHGILSEQALQSFLLQDRPRFEEIQTVVADELMPAISDEFADILRSSCQIT